MNIFEKASKQALRFSTTMGKLTTEDLWTLSLEQLDIIAKNLNKRVKESSEESFITTTRKDTKLELQFEIVKHIITVKLDAQEKAKIRAINKERKEVLLKALADKENAQINNLSTDDILAELSKIDNETE